MHLIIYHSIISEINEINFVMNLKSVLRANFLNLKPTHVCNQYALKIFEIQLNDKGIDCSIQF